MLTNDIQALSPGSGCYSAYLTPQGRMLADMRVLDLGEVLLIDLDHDLSADVLARLDQFVFSEDVELGDVTETFGLVSVVGPSAAVVMSSVLGELPAELGSWTEFQNTKAAFAGDVAFVVSSTEVGAEGFDVFVPRETTDRLISKLQAAGAASLSPEAAEILRVEAGRPAFGRDMDRDTIPLEAGIEGRAISFTKGCYPGQEVVIRILHRGHGRIARRLSGLVFDGDTVPRTGDLVRSGGSDAGRITSAVWSPLAGRPIAFAMLHRDFLAPGTALDVLHGDDRSRAAVVEMGRWDRRS
jgi:folate-binding protein YgfZ